MHPARVFQHPVPEHLLAPTPFATLTAAGLPRAAVAHAPVLVLGAPLRVQFHLARANALVPALRAGAEAIAVILSAEAYVSPDWYADRDTVPTWNYVAAELAGPARELAPEALVQLLDNLSAQEEAQLTPKTPWTRAKMSRGRFEALLAGIAGFEIAVTRADATVKLSQNKTPADRAGVIAGLTARGRPQDRAIARLMDDPSPLIPGTRP